MRVVIEMKNLINTNNKILYSVPYQYYTNAIENFFSIMKSHLQKLTGLTYINLKTNIQNVINKIPKEKYKNILNCSYNRSEKYYKKQPSNRNKTLKNYL